MGVNGHTSMPVDDVGFAPAAERVAVAANKAGVEASYRGSSTLRRCPIAPADLPNELPDPSPRATDGDAILQRQLEGRRALTARTGPAQRRGERDGRNGSGD